MAVNWSVREEGAVQLKDGTFMFYLQEGQGPPVLLLHAFGGSSFSWRKVIPALTEQFTVHAVDLPGYDRSSVPNRHYAIEDYTDAIVEYMDQMGLQQTNFIGNLTGAMISIDLAGRYPDRVDKLVLVSSPGWTPEEGARVFWNWFVPRQPKGQVDPDAFGTPIGETPEDPEEEAFAKSIRTRSPYWDASNHQENTRWDVPAHAAKVNAPTLLAYGETDPQLRREAKMLETIKGSRSVHIPNSSMGVPGQNPDGLAKEAIAFLKG